MNELMSLLPPHRHRRKRDFDHMEEVRKNAVDVSAFFFFEATGDSEADNLNDPDAAAAAIDRSHPDIDDDGDDDDAESCSCDLSDGFSFVIDRRLHHQVNGCDSRPCCCSTADDDDDDNDEEEEEEGEEAHSYSRCSCKNNGAAVEGEKKSSVSVESSGEIMSEKEKNRLFWETCLAS